MDIFRENIMQFIRFLFVHKRESVWSIRVLLKLKDKLWYLKDIARTIKKTIETKKLIYKIIFDFSTQISTALSAKIKNYNNLTRIVTTKYVTFHFYRKSK